MARKKMSAGLKIAYAKKNLFFFNALMVSLCISNIFDNEYISVINSMDDTRAGSTSYDAGAPFSTIMTVSLEI
jgi:iron complex outermembrane receptor protein